MIIKIGFSHFSHTFKNIYFTFQLRNQPYHVKINICEFTKQYILEAFMDVIRYTTKLKASGAEYKKIVFWNRFLRNKLEAIFSIIPALSSILLLYLGFYNPFFVFAYIIFCVYPFFIYTQFRSAVDYHLKHRDQSETAPCEITFMENGILAEINEFDLRYLYH